MAETKNEKLERIYTVPLRRAWLKKASYRRSGIAAKTIKIFIAKHMKVENRDVNKVKLDVYLNNEIWFRGKEKPPAKVKVVAIREKDIVRVTLAEMPAVVKFNKARLEKRHKPSDKAEKPAKKDEKPKDEKDEEEKKKNESEKEKATAEVREHAADQAAKTAKHVTKVKGESFHRMALQK